jgi:hypothetical protein
MAMPIAGGELSVALVNAVLLALWAALPGLLLGYVRQAEAARRIGPDFALRKSETSELMRAVPLYETVRARLDELEAHEERPGFWRALLPRQPEHDAADAAEIDDLRAHAEHLRATIIRLKRRPLRRLRSWAHGVSARAALGRAAIAHAVAMTLLIAAYQVPGSSAWADAVTPAVNNTLVWYPLDRRLFYANAAAALLAAVVAALSYLAKRLGLRRRYALDFCVFADLADSDPAAAIEGGADAAPHAVADSWFVVLGLSSAASIAEVKDAYKALIKQNHPDRVHGLSPAFRKLAEAESKKINAAYQEALVALSVLTSERAAA